MTNKYIELEYMESTGTQYIDSLLTMEKSDSVVIEINAKLTNNDSYGGVNGYLQYQANIGSGNKGIIKVDYDGTSYIEKIYFEDTLKSTSNWSSFSSSNNKIGIIGMGQGNNSWWTNSSRSAQSGQWYYVKIYKNNQLMRNFIPVKQISDDEIGMYDKITNTFFSNVGTGTFIGGPITSEINLLKINGLIQPKINGKKVYLFNGISTHYNFDFNSFYTIIDYIEGTGTQWIDTGIQPTTSTKIATKCSFSVDGGNVFIGATGLPDNNDFRIFRASGAYLYFDRGSGRLQNSLALNTVYELEFGNWYMKINGQTVQSGNAFNISLSSSTIKVMPTTNADYGKIYYLKIYDGDTLVRDFIPVKRNKDNAIGLYDKVTKQFFNNQGTGTFIGG